MLTEVFGGFSTKKEPKNVSLKNCNLGHFTNCEPIFCKTFSLHRKETGSGDTVAFKVLGRNNNLYWCRLI